MSNNTDNEKGMRYHFSFSAPASVTSEELEHFLKSVEQEARQMGFFPTLVLNARFDDHHRIKFVTRITKGLILQNDMLIGASRPNSYQICDYDPVLGQCRVLPEEGVLLIVTDEAGRETPFGFFRYPRVVVDVMGHELMDTGTNGKWIFEGFVDAADDRGRKIARKFAEAGFMMAERDGFS